VAILCVMAKSQRASRTLIIPDVHAPYHDQKAWGLVLRVIRELQPENVVIIGDFADCYAVSAHAKTLGRRSDFAWEVEQVNGALDELQEVAPSLRYVGGNHEWRLDRYLAGRAPELGGLAGLSYPALVSLRKRGIPWTPYQSMLQLGNVGITHDLGRAGAHAARQSLIDYGGNLVIGHTHRGGVAYQGESKGSSHFCLNVGWLGDLSGIDYAHQAKAKRDWQLGFGLIDQDGRSSWAQFVPIVRYRCAIDGQVIS
jgi:predicted phosphodiesterase